MTQALLFLAAALVAVPIAVRLGLGSVLGYLLAGVAIGPVGLALVSDPQAILHLSELGVVLMLFVIGLELEPRRLWAMRGAVFGGGTLQMVVCAALLAGLGIAMGWRWQSALVAGLALALSSTAIVVALLQERHLMALPLGRNAFSMLLFQDIAAIPLLALAAALGSAVPASDAHGTAGTAGPLLQAGAIVGVVLAGRFLAYPLMRFVARMQVRELFTAFALLLVLGVAALMERVGLSMGLGAFIAGVLLASSEYRHALEIDILPFKGLLLGLFFIAVGMSMQLGLVVTAPLQVLLGLVLVVALKALGLWLLAPRVGLTGRPRLLLGTGVKPTVIDHDADTVDSARRFGFKVHFGDATQPDLLHAAGIHEARVVVVAMDDVAQCDRLVHELRQHHPQVRVIARARDALHAMALQEAGAHHVEREVFEGSLRSARATLEALGHDRFQARQLADRFRRYSTAFLQGAAGARHNETDLIARVRQAREQFEREMQQDLAASRQRGGDGAWQAGAPPGDDGGR